MPESKGRLEGLDHLRPQIFGDLIGKVEPDRIPQIIEEFVRRTIEGAPLIDNKKIKSDISDGGVNDAGIMLFKIPDDLHLMALVEREMYKQFHEIDTLNGKLQVSPELIAPLDPKLPEILKLYYPEEDIRIETTFDHELRHYLELDESGSGVYIAFGMGKVKLEGRKVQLVFRGGAMGAVGVSSSTIADINSTLGPLYPSNHDLEHAKSKAEATIRHSSPRAQDELSEAGKVLEYISTLESSEEHNKKIVEAWIDYTWHDGIELSKIQAGKVRSRIDI